MKDRVKQLRKLELKLSQTEFGKKIGLSPQAIANIETGVTPLTDRNFNAICKAFSVNPDWLRNGVGEMFIETRETIIAGVVAEFGLTAEDAVLIRTYLELSPEQRAATMSFIKKFAANMAAQMGLPPLEDEKPDNELTPDEAAAVVRRERLEELEARKRGTLTSLAFTGTNGSSKKFGNSS